MNDRFTELIRDYALNACESKTQQLFLSNVITLSSQVRSLYGRLDSMNIHVNSYDRISGDNKFIIEHKYEIVFDEKGSAKIGIIRAEHYPYKGKTTRDVYAKCEIPMVDFLGVLNSADEKIKELEDIYLRPDVHRTGKSAAEVRIAHKHEGNIYTTVSELTIFLDDSFRMDNFVAELVVPQKGEMSANKNSSPMK